ncbi:MAG TPA: translation initiation factor IF-2 subunit alpha [Euryarchaeota archaeon]|nr:MAG: translation initiation factor IF-2 subunit alpha [Thermococci archaeon]RLF94069.1 MAG: translation initiation factor IF-2 subunit alpha [Thermococci archaeon]HDI10425.1 translation initiation factor IF-2 subunit alpha [Euryarchaeota archaeon]
MVRKNREWPEVGELVVGTVKKVFSHGAFVNLEEYMGKEGFIHISEVASKWVRNIRDFVREDQKVVCKVLRVNPQKGHIDLSLRRVADRQRQKKMQEWKQELKGEKLMELAARKLGKSLDEAYEEVGFKLQDVFGGIYPALEALVLEGKKALEGIIPDNWLDELYRVAKENVEPPRVKIEGTLSLSTPHPEGVKWIKKAIREGLNSVEDSVEIEVKYSGAPNYSVIVRTTDYRKAEEALKKFIDKAISVIEQSGGKGGFERRGK